LSHQLYGKHWSKFLAPIGKSEVCLCSGQLKQKKIL
jgi:hypothetical protein